MTVYLRRSLLASEIKTFIKESLHIESIDEGKFAVHKTLILYQVDKKKDKVIIPFGFYQKMREKFNGKYISPVYIERKEIKIKEDMPKLKVIDEYTKSGKEEKDQSDKGSHNLSFFTNLINLTTKVKDDGTVDLKLKLNEWPQFPNDSLSYKKVEFESKITLLPRQEPVSKELFEHLATDRGCLLALYCGFGKTVVAEDTQHKLKLQMMVLTHLLPVAEQWPQTAREYTKARCVRIESEEDMIKYQDYDMFVTTPLILQKIDAKYLKGIGIFAVDEAERLCTEVFHKAFFKLRPKYVIPLTATPDNRKDGFSRILPIFFGDKRITRISDKPFMVYRHRTELKPRIVSTSAGLDWNTVISSLAPREARNIMIADWIKANPNEKIVVACIRKDLQAVPLKKILDARGEDSSLMIGSTKKYTQARVLIATIKKISCGWDDKMNCVDVFDGVRYSIIILAWTVKDPEQLVMRVFRDEQPKIIELVDKFPSFEKHCEKRDEWYTQPGRNARIIRVKGPKKVNANVKRKIQIKEDPKGKESE